MSEAVRSTHSDQHTAREQMIQQQLRTWEVLDDEVLQRFSRLDRTAFVPANYRSLAYADLAIPLGEGEHMLAPKLAGRIVQAIKPGPNHRVLEIGTGSGFLTAALAGLACSVRSIERRPEQAERARAALAAAGVRNAEVMTADAYQPGVLGDGLYDVVVLGGSLPQREPLFESRLAVGGRLFAVIGQGPAMAASLIERSGEDAWRDSVLFETVLKPLHGAVAPARFRF